MNQQKAFSLFVIILSILFIDCEDNKITQLDTLSSSPYLLSANLSYPTLNLDFDTTGSVVPTGSNSYRVSLGLHGKILRRNSIPPLYCFLQVYKPGEVSPFTQFTIQPVGNSSDTIALDLQESLSIERADAGIFRLDLFLEDNSGHASNVIQNSLLITRLNSRPRITLISMPDSITLGFLPASDSTFLVSATAADSDGIGDIARVEFSSKKPDSTAGNCGNSVQLYDDGSQVALPFGPNSRSGDLIAGDGVFSFKLPLRTRVPNGCTPDPLDSVDTQRGIYRFTFLAQDKDGALSDSVAKNIKVK